MKKLLIMLVLVVLSGFLAGTDVIIVNNVFSPEGGQLMDALQNFVLQCEWADLTNSEKPGDMCLFINEYLIPKGMDPDMRSFSITYTVVEHPFGDYAEFVPLSEAVSGTWYAGTNVFLLDSQDMVNGLREAIYEVETNLYLFLATYGNFIYQDEYESWESRLVEELQMYCESALQWFISPVSQGGAGQKISKSAARELAKYLGFDATYLNLESYDTDVAYSISKVSNKTIELKAHPLDDSYHDGPLYNGRINLRNKEIEIIRNPLYD